MIDSKDGLYCGAYMANKETITSHLKNKKLNYTPNEIHSALILAIRAVERKIPPIVSQDKSLEAVITLISFGADIHGNQGTALNWAMRLNNHRVVKYILENHPMDHNNIDLDHDATDDYLQKNHHTLDPIISTILENLIDQSSTYFKL